MKARFLVLPSPLTPNFRVRQAPEILRQTTSNADETFLLQAFDVQNVLSNACPVLTFLKPQSFVHGVFPGRIKGEIGIWPWRC